MQPHVRHMADPQFSHLVHLVPSLPTGQYEAYPGSGDANRGDVSASSDRNTTNQASKEAS
jgi:hypothetical protein